MCIRLNSSEEWIICEAHIKAVLYNDHLLSYIFLKQFIMKVTKMRTHQKHLVQNSPNLSGSAARSGGGRKEEMILWEGQVHVHGKGKYSVCNICNDPHPHIKRYSKILHYQAVINKGSAAALLPAKQLIFFTFHLYCSGS